jgi:hypothetical protein
MVLASYAHCPGSVGLAEPVAVVGPADGEVPMHALAARRRTGLHCAPTSGGGKPGGRSR